MTPGDASLQRQKQNIKSMFGPLFQRKSREPSSTVAHPRAQGLIAEVEAIRHSGLFDANWYVERNSETESFPDPITHYVSVGAERGLAPHPLFDLSWYQDSNPGLVESGLTPLGHFLLSGEAAGASPSPLFVPDWYRSQDPSLSNVRVGLFLHFLQKGAVLGLSPHPAFDSTYYRRARSDVATAGINPLTHFIETGASEGTSPSPFFDVRWYLSCNPDVVKSGINPLVHFLRWGATEGRAPHPDIDLRIYPKTHPDCPRNPIDAYLYLVKHETPEILITSRHNRSPTDLASRLTKSGVFDPEAYLSFHEDIRIANLSPVEHFVQYGLYEGRRFTSSETTARLLANMEPEMATARAGFLAAAERSLVDDEAERLAAWFREKDVTIGVFSHSKGNFFMHEIANLLIWGLQALGIRATHCSEMTPRDEPLDLRVFVAPHEFFYIGEGKKWLSAAGLPNSVLYNVEQMQTRWFCRAFMTLISAPLLLDISFQSTEMLRRLDCNVVHFMPGYLRSSPYAAPCEDVSDVSLVSGYEFAHKRLNWMAHDSIDDRPIDILFIGSGSPRRDKVLARLIELTDEYRFLCVYKNPVDPLTTENQLTSSTRINCALAQRSKIVLNIHRDWVSYFEWNRIGLLGFWQGACVVSDPSLPHPLYQPGVHYLEESTRHIGELIRWLLDTKDGLETLNTTRRAGLARARELGSMRVALVPVLDAFKKLLV